MVKTSIIIPAYNEEEGLPKVIEECQGMVDEIIVVDDGSSDKTYEVAKNYNLKLYRHEKNMGKVAAIQTGMQNATGDIIILTDADYTYPASYIPQFIKKIEDGADLVLGSRFMHKVDTMPFLNKVGNRILSFLASYIGCMNLNDAQTGYRAFRKDMFDNIHVHAKSLEYETKMTVRAAKLGYKIAEVPIEYRERIGKSKLKPVRDGIRMFGAIVSVAISEISLLVKTIFFISFFLISIGMVMGFISLYEKLKFGILSHEYYPLITTLFVLVGIQLICFGFIMDYLMNKLRRIEEKLM